MKYLNPTSKNLFKMLLIILALTIGCTQMYVIGFESKQEEQIEGKCEFGKMIIEIGIKCSLAFLAGGLLSELRFMKFGSI